ncbi:hypothetical protein [Komagataeibacter xylinus]|uniref:YcxB-like protein domain-containing protein n=1 Tax=Komagataeibacter xylinus TaxID=28448 RepID=A0A857FPF3_KOMXY|nr:hypothetical protein [Komagataeibacter xylinus]QHC35399.1 hypothetical protein FMA36_07690 [Komagataeibacter xylinus]
MHDDTPSLGAVTGTAATEPQAGTGFQPITGTHRTTLLDVLAQTLLNWKSQLVYGVLIGVQWSFFAQAHVSPPFDHAMARRQWGLAMELLAMGAFAPAVLAFIVLVGLVWLWLCIRYYCRRHVLRSTIYTLSANSISVRDATGIYADIPWNDFRIIRPTGRLLILRMSAQSRRLVIPWSSFASQDVQRARTLIRRLRMQHAAPTAARYPAGTTGLLARDAEGDNVTVPLLLTKGEMFSVFLRFVPWVVAMVTGWLFMLNLVVMFMVPANRAVLSCSTSMINKARLLLGLDAHTVMINASIVILTLVFLSVQHLRQIKARSGARVRIDAKGISLLDMDQDKVRVFNPWAVLTATSTSRFLKIRQGKRMSFYYPWRLFSPQDRVRILAWAAQARSTAQS